MSTPASQPDFWNPRYESGRTPWDFGGVPAAVSEYLTSHPAGGRVLIPGCGSGYELAAFAAAGYDALAIDFAPAAVARAQERLGQPLARRVVLDDFFRRHFGAPFDLIYERTFLCALPPDLRSAYARRMTELVRPGGLIVGFFFFENTPVEDGPPWGLAPGAIEKLLGKNFHRVQDRPVSDSLPIFLNKERWQEWRRT
jgi:SAM-dependent methyltransferase